MIPMRDRWPEETEEEYQEFLQDYQAELLLEQRREAVKDDPHLYDFEFVAVIMQKHNMLVDRVLALEEFNLLRKK